LGRKILKTLARVPQNLERQGIAVKIKTVKDLCRSQTKQECCCSGKTSTVFNGQLTADSFFPKITEPGGCKLTLPPDVGTLRKGNVEIVKITKVQSVAIVLS